MKNKKSLIKNKACMSAVIGVILMIVITVVITAAIVHVHVCDIVKENQNNNYTHQFNIIGKLKQIKINNGFVRTYDIKIENVTYNNINNIYNDDNNYLNGMIGQNITLVLEKHPYCDNYEIKYTYYYVEAYIN